MQRVFVLLSFILFLSLFSGCKKDESTSALDGCCDTPAINATIGNGHLYVANIITSNADGINDYVWPWCDIYIIRIIRFQVKNKQGQLVFEALDESPNDSSKGWNGNINGQWVEGVYDIVVEAEAEDGTTGIVEGKVCNFRCRDSETSEPISSDGCQFPTQVSDGHYDSSISSSEPTGCFN